MLEPPAAAAWGPWEFQLATNWTIEEPAAEIWAPGLPSPVEYASIVDIFGTCSLQPYAPEYSLGQQQVEYYFCAAASQHHPADDEAQNWETMTVSNDSRASGVFEQVAEEFKEDVDLITRKMHRYPASLGALDECYTVPRIVAIGPYYHGREHLKPAEKVKHMAVIQCVKESGRLAEDLYGAVSSAADDARRLYDKDVMAGIGYDDFRVMMSFDACFLVQYMLARCGAEEVDPSLRRFLRPNRIDIHHDVMLLENQIPWRVLVAVMRFSRVSPWRFSSMFRGCLQKLPKQRQEDATPTTPTAQDDSKNQGHIPTYYRPPHLLGLLRYVIVGRSHTDKPPTRKTKQRSFSVAARELAEIGITLTANKTTELIHMGVRKKGPFFAELCLAPLYLDRVRASYLVNMAALELCTVESFSKAPHDEDSAVCSYLLLLAMLVHREEDVQELRERGLLHGGGGLTNQEALRFFTGIQSLRLGPCYNRIMAEIESYKENRRMVTKLHAFWYRNKKTIMVYFTVFVGVAGLISALVTISTRLKFFKGGR